MLFRRRCPRFFNFGAITMLSVHNLSKSYGVTPLFTNVTFSLDAGEKAGLVGPNGCGKTTLLRLINGDEPADSGVVSFNPPCLLYTSDAADDLLCVDLGG